MLCGNADRDGGGREAAFEVYCEAIPERRQPSLSDPSSYPSVRWNGLRCPTLPGLSTGRPSSATRPVSF